MTRASVGFVPPRIGGRNGFHRRRSQSGMIGADDATTACDRCHELVASDQLYEGWCFSCVLAWGHPEDAAAVANISHGWTRECAIAATVDKSSHGVHPMSVAVRSFGVLDLAGESKYGRGVVNIEFRTSAVAGDGFLYDDDPVAKAGPKSAEVRAHFQSAVAKLVKAGYSIRAIQRVTGLAKNTVLEYRKRVTEAVFCPCGIAMAFHPAWCRVRFRASRKRQEFMREWHPSSEWPFIERDGFRVGWEQPPAVDAVDPALAARGTDAGPRA